MEITPGAIVAGRYRADRKIGAGAMGEVWAGENISVGTKVAIKTMLEAAAVDHEVVARFKREAYILGKIRSDYVARVLDFAQDETYGLVLILDLIEGEVFSNTLKRTRLTVEEAINVGFDVASGLVDLHSANIVHRDLKPSNIILQPRPDGGQRAIIVDFGVSRLMKSDDPDEEITNITRADMALGTLEYMAPEQMLDSRNVTGGSDVYAVGAMLYRAVKGSHAFGDLADLDLARKKLLEETPRLETGRDDPVAKGFEECIWRAVRRKPADRYKEAVEMVHDLGELRRRMLGPDAPAEGRRTMPSMIEDEPTVDITESLVPIEASASFQVDRPTSMSAAKKAMLADRPSSSDANRLSSSGSTTSPTLPPAGSAGSAVASVPRAPQPSFSDLVTPPVRTGVSTGLVVALVLGALIGGVALGILMMTNEHSSGDPQASSAAPSTSSMAAPTATATAAATSTSTAPSDAGISDAAADAARLDASVSDSGAADAAASSPYPFPQFAPKQPAGGPLPGRPLGGGPLPGAGGPPPPKPPP